MKITVNKTTKEEVDITLPYFFKTSAHWVAIFSEETGVLICDTFINKTITIAPGTYIYNSMSVISERDIITEQEFSAKYDEVNEINNNLINKYR